MSPRSGLSQHYGPIRYNDKGADNMIANIEEEEDKEEEDVDKDDRSLNPSSRPKSKASNSKGAIPDSSHHLEDVQAPEASLSAPDKSPVVQVTEQPDIINFQNN